MKYRDLPRNPDPFVMLYCRTCGGTYSATRGDYFMRLDDQAMCLCSGKPLPLQLVRKRSRYEPVKAIETT